MSVCYPPHPQLLLVQWSDPEALCSWGFFFFFFFLNRKVLDLRLQSGSDLDHPTEVIKSPVFKPEAVSSLVCFAWVSLSIEFKVLAVHVYLLPLKTPSHEHTVEWDYDCQLEIGPHKTVISNGSWGVWGASIPKLKNHSDCRPQPSPLQTERNSGLHPSRVPWKSLGCLCSQ